MEAALDIRRHAEDTRRQMEELLAWENDLKARPPPQGKQKQQHQQLPSPDSLRDALTFKEKGNAYFKLGSFEKAVRAYTRALALLGSDAQNSAVVCGNRAMAYLKLKNYEAALSDCTTVLEIDPKNVKALWRRGVAKLEIGFDLQGAKADFDKALVLDPTNKAVKQEQVRLAAAMSAAKKVTRKRIEIVEVGDPKLYKLNESKPVLLEVSAGDTSLPAADSPSLDSNVSIMSLKTERETSAPVITEISTPAWDNSQKSDSYNKQPSKSSAFEEFAQAASPASTLANSTQCYPAIRKSGVILTRGIYLLEFALFGCAAIQIILEISPNPSVPMPAEPADSRENTLNMDTKVTWQSSLEQNKLVTTVKTKKSIFEIVSTAEDSIEAIPATAIPNPQQCAKSKLLIQELDTNPPRETLSLAPQNRTLPAIVDNLITFKVAGKPCKPPATFIEFEMEWKQRRQKPEDMYMLVKAIDPASYRSLFRNSLESAHLSAILHTLCDFYIPYETPARVCAALHALTGVQRFAVNAMFMDSRDKDAATQLLDFVANGSGSGWDAAELLELKSKFLGRK